MRALANLLVNHHAKSNMHLAIPLIHNVAPTRSASAQRRRCAQRIAGPRCARPNNALDRQRAVRTKRAAVPLTVSAAVEWTLLTSRGNATGFTRHQLG
jgi:hypothetical protein